MNRTIRRVGIFAGFACAVAVIVFAVQARVHVNDAASRARVPAPLAIGTELQRPPHVPRIRLIGSNGRPTSLSAWHGKWVVLAPSMTLCGEVCPMTTGALIQLTDQIRRAGLGHQVVVAEATVDPWRDTPRRLRAYARLAGVNFEQLTGSRENIRRLWKFFGVEYHRVKEDNPPDIDWMTHRPEKFDIDHTDALFIISPSGQERIADEGMPDVDGHLSHVLRGLLDSQGKHNLAHPQLPWTAHEVFEDVNYLMGRTIPAKSAPQTTAPSAAAAERRLAGSPHPLAAIHAQAGRLIGGASGLSARLAALRGRYPVVLNVWASWCPGCREEFPLFGSASATYGTRVAFLGVDTNDPSQSDAQAFLAKHHVSYPSYRAQSSQLTSLATIQGFPTTIYIGRNGKVRDVHLDQYQTAASLDNDIRRYALEGR